MTLFQSSPSDWMKLKRCSNVFIWDSHMNRTGVVVVLLRGVNFGFWSHLGCSGQNPIIFSHKGLF